MATRLRRIGWALAFLSLAVLGIPWFLWGVDTVIFGLPVWIWWHAGVMITATLTFWLFAREDWGLWIEPGDEPRLGPEGDSPDDDRGGDGL